MNIFQKTAQDIEDQWREVDEFNKQVIEIMGVDPNCGKRFTFREVPGYTIFNPYESATDPIKKWTIVKGGGYLNTGSEEERNEFLTELRKVAQENV